MVAGVLMVAVVWVFLLRYVPDQAITVPGGPGSVDSRIPSPGLFVPGRDDLWDAFAPRAAVALLALLGFGLVGGWFLAGRVLAPLDRLTEVARGAGSGSLSQRVRLPGRQDELRELADAFDAMLDRLQAHVAEQQRFAANASHELRTPLAVVRTLLDVARDDPDLDTGQLLDRLRTVTDRAVDLTEALLALSRADAGPVPQEPVDLSLAAEEAVEQLLPLAASRGVTLEVTGGRAVAPGSPALLLQLVTNLVHNAVVHNLPEHGTVTVSTSSCSTDDDRDGGRGATSSTVVLTVESTGEVLDPDLVATLTEPFRRGAGRVRADHAGVGLGLAVVDRVTAAHGGTLSLRARPGGGLVVVVRLPAATAER